MINSAHRVYLFMFKDFSHFKFFKVTNLIHKFPVALDQNVQL